MLQICSQLMLSCHIITEKLFQHNPPGIYVYIVVMDFNALFSGSGWYMFIETSPPRLPYDKARLISPLISDGVTRCLSFWYHMYGAHINKLNVYLMTSGALDDPVWTKSGTQGDAWHKGSLTIQSKATYQVSDDKVSEGYHLFIGLDVCA